MADAIDGSASEIPDRPRRRSAATSDGATQRSATSSACRILFLELAPGPEQGLPGMKLCMAVTGSDRRPPIERRQEPLRVGRQHRRHQLPERTDLGGVEHVQQCLRGHVDRRRLDLIDDVARVRESPGRLPNAVPHLRAVPRPAGSVTSATRIGLAGSGPRSGAGTVQGRATWVRPGPRTPLAGRRPAAPSDHPRPSAGSRSAHPPARWRSRAGSGLGWASATLIPQHWAGQRSDPSPSLPSPRGLMPVASAAASPPLEAPGVATGPTG